MKKSYVKPALYIENYSLSQSVATNCGVPKEGNSLGTPTAGSPATCGWQVPGMPTTWTSSSVCVSIKGEDFSIGGACYNNPQNANALFGWS